MNFEPSHRALESWLDRGNRRDGNVNINDNDTNKRNNVNNCSFKTLFISSRKVLNYLPRAQHVSRVYLDLSFLSPADIAYFVSVVALPPYNIKRIVVRHNPDGDHQRKLRNLLNELHQQKLHHLKSLRFQKTMPLTNTMLPLLQKILIANVSLATLDLTFDTIDPTIAGFLVHVLSNGLSNLNKLHLTFLSQAQAEPDIDEDGQRSAWRECFRRSILVYRHIHTIHVTGDKAFFFLSGIFPNIKCVTMSCEDQTPNTHIFQEKSVIAMFHQCIQLNLTLTSRFLWLAPAITTVQILTLDVRHVRALNDDIAEDLVELLSHPYPNLRNLAILQRSMSKLQFLRLCHGLHHCGNYPNLASLSLDTYIPDLDYECRTAYLQIIKTCPTIVTSSASCMDNHAEHEAQYLCIANKIRLSQLLRHDWDIEDQPNDDEHNNDTAVTNKARCVPLALWSHILSALHPHPSIIYTLLKEKSSELIHPDDHQHQR